MHKLSTVILSLALAFTGAAVTHHTADACGGGYSITERDRALWALQAFLGELGKRVTYGPVGITDGPRAEIAIEMDTRAAGGRTRVQQTFLLEKRDGVWAVVDWTFPVAAPAKVTRR